MNGLPMSASVTPVAFSSARCGARSMPRLIWSERMSGVVVVEQRFGGPLVVSANGLAGRRLGLRAGRQDGRAGQPVRGLGGLRQAEGLVPGRMCIGGGCAVHRNAPDVTKKSRPFAGRLSG